MYCGRQELALRGEGILEANDGSLLTYLVDLQLEHRGSPLAFHTCPNPHTHPKPFEIWHVSLVAGDRPGSGWWE